MPAARVAVVTVAFGSSGELPQFLETARAQGKMVGRVIVADNPSTDSARSAEITLGAGAEFLPLSSNRGYGGAVNAAVATLGDDVEAVLVSNPDVQLGPGAVDALLAALDADPGIGAVGPKVLNQDGTVYPSARDIPSLRTGVGHALFSHIWPRNPWTRRYRQDGFDVDAARDVGWLSGACLLVRRSAFAQIGGFDDRYFMYFEDVDLGYRLSRAGWRNCYRPSAVVTHVGGTSTVKVRTRMLRVHHESAYRFLAAKYRGWYLAPLRWALHIGLHARGWWLTRGLSR